MSTLDTSFSTCSCQLRPCQLFTVILDFVTSESRIKHIEHISVNNKLTDLEDLEDVPSQCFLNHNTGKVFILAASILHDKALASGAEQ